MSGIRFTERPLVYIAGPYSKPDPVVNTRAAILAADDLAEAGLVTPVVPHTSHLWHLVAPHHLEWWYEYDLALLARCDIVYRLEGASPGADAEVRFAKDLDLPVAFTVSQLDAFVAAWYRRHGIEVDL